MNNNIVKIWRYIRMLGIRRTLVKICGRLRISPPLFLFLFRRKPRIGIIGCGQFAFSTIGYFVYAKTRESFAACFDTNEEAARSFASFYHVPTVAATALEIITDPAIEIIYIASDHYSHAQYAELALRYGKKIHLEKPIAVSFEQLAAIKAQLPENSGQLVAGYNRPYAGAVKLIDRYLRDCKMPLVLNCFVVGHKIPIDHWYRIPKEGGRICGNVGHWLDLAVHWLSMKGNFPRRLHVQFEWSDPGSSDDNFSISFSSDEKDLVIITLTSQSEPLEGIHESIQLQCGELIACIDDFRSVEIWNGSSHLRRSYSPKDVGHAGSVLQLLSPSKELRPWREVEISTELMLRLHEKETAHCREFEYVFDRDADL